MSTSLSASQIRTLTIVERCASILSVLGIATIIFTFSFSRHFRNPIHRIIFINAFYNLFDVIATLISLSGPEAGNSSALCQFQGFCLQLFPLADVLWTLAMAYDVFLVVFYYYDVDALRKLEIKYICIITALVSIPAVTFLFIHTEDKGPMYGSVTLWCSISPRWVLFRIIFYYGPIWVIILITMILYFLVGFEILRWKYKLKATSDYNTQATITSRDNNTSSDHLNDNNLAMVTVETDFHSQPAVHIAGSQHDGKQSAVFATLSPISSAVFHQNSTSPLRQSYNNASSDNLRQPPKQSTLSFRQYILMPMIFFLVLLATWMAPTINRIHVFIDPNYVSFPLLLAVGSMGSLRGFWNGIIFVTLGMKVRKRQKNLTKRGFY